MNTRSRPLRALTIAIAAVALPAVTSGAWSAEEWALFAREGGCHPIQSLKRRLADLPDIRDPEAFQAYVSSKGWPFSRKNHPMVSGKAVEFVVESQGLALMFVTRELCSQSRR
jgi:hypothetical protein